MKQQPEEPQQIIPWLTPGRLFLFSSIPLSLGTYIGYRRALAESSGSSGNASESLLSPRTVLSQIIHNYKRIIPSSSSSSSLPSDLKVVRVNAPLLAVRALAVGSLLSVTGTSLLISSVFYACDAHSVHDLITKWRTWGPATLRRVENALGVENDNNTEVRQYERDVRGMSEDEEWEYVTKRYGNELRWEEEK